MVSWDSNWCAARPTPSYNCGSPCSLALQSEPCPSRSWRWYSRSSSRAPSSHSSSCSATRRARAAQAVRDSEERFRLLADRAPVLLWTTRPDTTLDYLNRTCSEFTGLPLDQLVDDGWLDGVHPDDVERCKSIYVPAIEARRPFFMEYRLRRADGAYGWLLDSAVPEVSGGRHLFRLCRRQHGYHRSQRRPKNRFARTKPLFRKAIAKFSAWPDRSSPRKTRSVRAFPATSTTTSASSWRPFRFLSARSNAASVCPRETPTCSRPSRQSSSAPSPLPRACATCRTTSIPMCSSTPA